MPPGNYDVVMVPPGEQIAFDGEVYSASEHAALLVVPGVKVDALAGGYGDFEKRAPLPCPIPEASGRAAGRVVLKDRGFWKAQETSVATLYLVIGGKQALSCLTFSLPDGLDPARKITVLGAFPGAAPLSAPGEFTITNLPPGEYGIFAQYKLNSANGYGVERIQPDGPPLRTFSVTKGETTQLGEVLLDIPLPLREKMRAQYEQYTETMLKANFGNAAGDDKDPGFRP
jgi:hypothetical protein